MQMQYSHSQPNTETNLLSSTDSQCKGDKWFKIQALCILHDLVVDIIDILFHKIPQSL